MLFRSESVNDETDGRSLAGKIRKMARTCANSLVVSFACDAVKSGIPASVTAFDSWFATPDTISQLVKKTGLTVIARLKTNSKQYYEYEGRMMNIKTIYTICSKRRGRAKWKLSVNVSLLVAKEWICILSTDTDMDENEIICQYGKRWNIEVMFKCCKQVFKFGKDFQSPVQRRNETAAWYIRRANTDGDRLCSVCTAWIFATDTVSGKQFNIVCVVVLLKVRPICYKG